MEKGRENRREKVDKEMKKGERRREKTWRKTQTRREI
jgi:hypothetical protein